MAFKELHKLKKIHVVEKETFEVDHLVVGKDIFSLNQYKNLVAEHGPDAVRLLSQDNILKSDLFPKGPSTIRGVDNINVFKELFSEVECDEVTDFSLFYKDMTWKAFGGRSKSEALLFDEEFFTTGSIRLDYKKLFTGLDLSEDYFNYINDLAYQVKIKSIKRHNDGFIVECINGTEFICKKLYMGLSPYKYLDLYSEKNELSDKFIEFCESTKALSALYVRFVFDKKILSDMKETLFIPLSYTHDWGHFVGEFKMNNDSQEIEFQHYIDEFEQSEEDLSRIIRLLKKSMEKIFTNFNKIKSQEFISIEQETTCLKIDDELFYSSLEAGKQETNNLVFIGVNAPIALNHSNKISFEYSSKKISGLTRAFLTK